MSLRRPALGVLLALLLALPLLALARAQETATPVAGPGGTPCPAASPASEGTPSLATPAATGTPDATPVAGCEEPGISTGTTIRIVDFDFEPAEAQVKVGTSVTWVNEGAAAHTSAAYVGGTKYWDSNILESGQSYAFTFTEPGSFDYLCTLHPTMKAHLDVVE